MSGRSQQIAVVLPLLLLAFMTGRAEWQLAHSQNFIFSIQGYDPRDLLRGHYLRFNLIVAPIQAEAACSHDDPDCCYCLERGEMIEGVGAATRAMKMRCDSARDTCESFVRSRPLHDLDRFYIAEDQRRELEGRLREAAATNRAHLVVAVDDEGRPMIESLLIDGLPIEAVTDDATDVQAQ